MSKKRKVIWNSAALRDRDLVFNTIAPHNLEAAERLDKGFKNSCDLLGEFSQMGRIGRVKGTRELVVYPYVLAYRVSPENIRILRLLHGRQEWPKRF